MHVRLTALAAAFIVSTTPAWAATSNEDVYGNLSMDVGLPTHETVSVALDVGSILDPTYIPQVSTTFSAGDMASISGDTYISSASTMLGSNHVYAQGNSFTPPAWGASSLSGWYDQVTITGGTGTGTGTAQFTVQLNGAVDVGSIAAGVGYALGASSTHPSQLVSDTFAFNTLSIAQLWPMDSVTPITAYSIGASPYIDTSNFLGLFASPAFDLVLTPGAGQAINATLHGTLSFTYGESFYLIGAMGAGIFDTNFLQAFCSIEAGDCVPPPDGSGATTLDFSNSANLINIALPEGANASFASGATYNVTTVPEPGEWLMLLAGLGLVGWRTRRKAA
jgi:hypothetical protein